MQDELISTAGRADKNVRQAGFWVLWAVAMPSVLVELDFICNPSIERFLNTKDGRQKCARALANAISGYYVHHRRAVSARGSEPASAGHKEGSAGEENKRKSGAFCTGAEDSNSTPHACTAVLYSCIPEALSF